MVWVVLAQSMAVLFTCRCTVMVSMAVFFMSGDHVWLVRLAV